MERDKRLIENNTEERDRYRDGTEMASDSLEIKTTEPTEKIKEKGSRNQLNFQVLPLHLDTHTHYLFV